MQIKQLYVNGVLGLDNVSVFFHKNTIVMGKNNSGKTRILLILEAILNQSKDGLKKLKSSCTKKSKIKVQFTYLGKNYYWVFDGEKLKPNKNNEDLTLDVCFIPSDNLDLNTWITKLMQKEISETDDFKNFKDKIEDLTNSYLKNINEGTFSDNENNDISAKPQDRLPRFKIQLFRNGLDINDQGGGFKKHIMIQLLLKNLLKSNNKLVLIDEIENHFSTKTIEFFLNNLSAKSQFIATSHRIEVNNPKINTITSLNNEILHKIGDYISSEMTNRIIVIEGKNYLPFISRALEILQAEKQFTIIVATSKEQAKAISVKYGFASLIGQDNEENSNNQNSKIYFTKRRKMENYLPQKFIDIDEKLKGIKINEGTTIESMFSSCSSKFQTKNEMQSYIAREVFCECLIKIH